MNKLPLNDKGFGLAGVLLVVLVLATAGGAGAYVYHQNHKSKNDTTTTASSNNSSTKANNSGSTSSTQGSSSTQAQQGYLVIKELGIRFKLSADIKNAYYKVKSDTRNGRPVVALYLHSLDSYPLCTPEENNDGVASLTNFVPGATDPVNGDVGSAYPNAPLISGLRYYISNEQFDCSEGKNPNMSAISKAFTAAYPTIEAYPAN